MIDIARFWWAVGQWQHAALQTRIAAERSRAHAGFLDIEADRLRYARMLKDGEA